MISKFDSRCASCGQRIKRGESINYYGRNTATHSDCEAPCEDTLAGLEQGTLANDRKLAHSGLTVVRFSSGETMTVNSRGRCEDAPCCGCCT